MRIAAVVALAMIVLAVPADAHGPCGCTFPTAGSPGVRVTSRSPAYKVVVNPRERDFTIGPGGLASAYRPEAPTPTVLSRSRRSIPRRTSFRMPAMPPGVYLLLIFDGSEGGTHYTWDYFHVLGNAAPAPQRSARDTSPAEGVLGVLGAAMLAGGVLVLVRYRP